MITEQEQATVDGMPYPERVRALAALVAWNTAQSRGGSKAATQRLAKAAGVAVRARNKILREKDGV
jgi:hypothetical protein